MTEKKETFSIRFDPKLRYMIEMVSRIEHINCSEVIENCIKESMKVRGYEIGEL